MSVSFTVATLAWLFIFTSALQPAPQQRLDSNQEEVNQEHANEEEGTDEGNDGEQVDHANDFYKIWYETSAGESTVHEEHDIPAEELADKVDTNTQVIGGDASLGGAGLEDEADIPGGIIFGDEPSALNASTEEKDPMQPVVKINDTEGSVTRNSKKVAPSAASEQPQAATDDNAVHGVDEFADPVEVKAVEEENVVDEADESVEPPKAVAVNEIDRAAPKTEASPGAREASEKKAEQALAKLLGRQGEAEQALYSVASKSPVMALDQQWKEKTLDNSMVALVWESPQSLHSLCNLSQATLLFFGVAVVIMVMGTFDFLVLHPSKHQAAAYEVTGTHVSKDHSTNHVPPPITCRLTDIVHDDGKGRVEDSLIEVVDGSERHEEGSSMDDLRATTAVMDEETGNVPKPEASALKRRAALTGTRWLSRKLGLICYAR